MIVASHSLSAGHPTSGDTPARRDAAEAFSLPPIRTMADDLADVARGTLVGVGDLPLAASTRAAGVPAPSSDAKLVRLPAAVRPRRRGLTVSLGLLGMLVFTGVGAWAAFRFIPVSSGTVADAVPAEAQAFISVRSGDSQTAALLAALLSPFEGLAAEHLRGTQDLTYLLLPGPSAAEPIPALLARGIRAVDLSGAPALGVRPMADGILITESTHLGRVNALSGKMWGAERTFRDSLRGFPEQAPVLLAFRSEALATFLQPFAPHALSVASPLVMAIVPVGDGSANLVARVGSVSSKVEQSSAPSVGSAGADGIGKLPQNALLALQRPVTVLANLPARAMDEQLPHGLRPVLQALQERATVFGGVLGSFEGVLTIGVLPTETAGVRDVVAVLPIRSGSDPSSQLRELENAGPAVAPYLTGAAFADAAFTETEYRGVRIRYMNFGSSVRSFDYAIVDQHLLVATSRASMYALLDVFQGTTPSLSEQASFVIPAGIAVGSSWTFFLHASLLHEELPSAYRVFAALDGVFLRPAGSGLFAGALVFAESKPGELLPSSVTPSPDLPIPTP